MLGIGDTFFFAVLRSHLWMVLTTPEGPEGTFIMVNVSTDRGKGEGVCILDQSDIPTFVEDPSEVRYKDAKRWQAVGPTGFNALQKAGKIIAHPPLSQATLIKVQAGCFGSELFRYFDDVVRHLVDPIKPDDMRLKIRQMAGIK